MQSHTFASLLMIASASASADVPQPSQPQAWRPDAIQWGDAAADGTRYALLEGSRDTQGDTFSYAFFIPAGTWDAPHAHSSTARVFVVTGELQIGYGADNDHGKARTYPAGSYLIMPAGTVHFDGAEQDTMIIGTAIGPWRTNYINADSPTSAGTPKPD